MINLRSPEYLSDYRLFYVGTLVKYKGNDNGLLKRDVIYSVDSFIDNSHITVYMPGVGNIKGRLLISLNLPNGKKTCYIPAHKFEKV